MNSFNGYLFFSLLLGAFCSRAAAQSTVTIPDEYGNLIRQQSDVSSYGDNLVGEKVDLNNGSLEIIQTDVDLPGNSMLPVRLSRRFNLEDALNHGHFGRWDLEIPNVHGIFPRQADVNGWVVSSTSTSDDYERCSKFSAPPQAMHQGAIFNPDEYWHGSFLHLPEVGDQELLVAGQNAHIPKDGDVYPIITKEGAAVRCIPISDLSEAGSRGEGFEVVMPDGIIYTLNHMVSREVSTLIKPDSTPVLVVSQAGDQSALRVSPQVAVCCTLGRKEVIIYPTKIADKFGNSVVYTWSKDNPWQLVGISANDGRQLNISYQDAVGYRVTTVSDGVKSWKYTYGDVWGAGEDTLTLPDGGIWKYNLKEIYSTSMRLSATCDSLGGLRGDNGDNDLKQSTSGSITTPYGATVEFVLSARLIGRSWVDRQCTFTVAEAGGTVERVREPYLFASWAVASKKITGPGLPLAGLSWTYEYGAPNNCWAPSAHYNGEVCTSASPITRTVSVTNPDGAMTRYTIGNRYRVNEGLLLKTEYGWNGTSSSEEIDVSYADSGSPPYASFNGSSIRRYGDFDITSKLHPQMRVITKRQGHELIWEVGRDCGGIPYCFDSYARPLRVTRSSSSIPQ